MTPLRFFPRPLALIGLPLLLAGCAIGPAYQQPEMALPTSFRHDAIPPGSAPALRDENQGTDWWAVYRDPVLHRLLREVSDANPALAQAEARHRQALALVGAARATALPQVGATLGATRSGGSAPVARRYQAGLEVSWTADLWGRVARQGEAARADADSAAATLAASTLALQLSAAQGYVRLRAQDLHQALLAQALTAYERSLQLTRNQYEAGFVARADVIQAETQLQSLRTQGFDIARQRALEENALAVLAGTTPSALQLAATDAVVLPAPPPAPVALPSALLRRRPDIAAAERQVAAANARIGVAQSAWLPDLTLSATGALQSSRWSGLFDAPVRVWSLGPSLAASLFDGGTRRAAEAQALAQYDEQVAGWRASVLQGIRETEDALASLQSLAGKDAQQQRLVELAGENERVVTNRYQAGEISFLEVATAQNLALTSRRTALDVQAERLSTSMQLIAALGGGWQDANRPAAPGP